MLKKILKRKKLLITLAIIVIVIILFTVFVRQRLNSVAMESWSVELEEAQVRDLSDYISLKGTVSGASSMNYSSSASSQILTVEVAVGDEVEVGDVIAAISLVVGGIGVMNIMLVSITERTKEIGIRKALGAKSRTIRQQFLIESVVLCVIGGVIGILLGLLFGFLLGRVAMMLINTYYADFSGYIVLNVRPSGVAIVLSVGFSMLIGIFFGFYPAKKAAEMEVIDALRYE